MPLHKDGILSKYFYPTTFALVFGGTFTLSNYYMRRPLYSAIHRQFLGAAFGWALGYYLDKYAQKRHAERDAIVKHYIELHPEDFVDNRRKYKEVFEEWYPVRGAN